MRDCILSALEDSLSSPIEGEDQMVRVKQDKISLRF